MIIEREILEGRLKDAIKEYARNRSVITQVTNELNNKNMIEGDIISIFQFTTPISLVDESVLYAFTKALFHATKNKNADIDPVKYFTKLEITEGDKWKKDIAVSVNDNEPVIFSPFIKINDNMWQTTKTIKELYDMFNVRKLTYNTKTQRPLKVSERNGKIIEKIDINPIAVREIEELITNDLYFQDPITINMLIDEALNLDEGKNELILSSGELNLIDGWHRLRGMFKALINSPNIDINIPITLTRLTESRAIDYIFQKSQHNPINKDYKKTINPSRLSNQIVDYLNSEKKSLLRGKVTKNAVDIKSNNSKAVVEFNTIADTIDLTFNPKEQSEIFQLNKFIMNGLNYIINVNPNLLKDKLEPKLWSLYICLLYLIKDYEDWENILEEITVKIDMNSINLKQVNKISIRNVIEDIKPLIKACVGALNIS